MINPFQTILNVARHTDDNQNRWREFWDRIIYFLQAAKREKRKGENHDAPLKTAAAAKMLDEPTVLPTHELTGMQNTNKQKT